MGRGGGGGGGALPLAVEEGLGGGGGTALYRYLSVSFHGIWLRVTRKVGRTPGTLLVGLLGRNGAGDLPGKGGGAGGSFRWTELRAGGAGVGGAGGAGGLGGLEGRMGQYDWVLEGRAGQYGWVDQTVLEGRAGQTALEGRAGQTAAGAVGAGRTV